MNKVVYTIMVSIFMTCMICAVVISILENRSIDYPLPIYVEFPYLQYHLFDVNISATELELHIEGLINKKWEILERVPLSKRVATLSDGSAIIYQGELVYNFYVTSCNSWYIGNEVTLSLFVNGSEFGRSGWSFTLPKIKKSETRQVTHHFGEEQQWLVTQFYIKFDPTLDDDMTGFMEYNEMLVYWERVS